MKVAKINLALLLLALALLFGFLMGRSFSQEADVAGTSNLNNISFSATVNTLKFFDPGSGRVYIYSDQSGQLRSVLEIRQLGRNLRKLY